MGWCSGGSLMAKIVESAVKNIPSAEQRAAFYVPVIRAFQYEDCDTLYECEGMDPAFDAALEKVG